MIELHIKIHVLIFADASRSSIRDLDVSFFYEERLFDCTNCRSRNCRGTIDRLQK